QGHRLVHRTVTDGEAGGAGEPRLPGQVREDVRARIVRVLLLAAGEVPQHDPSDALEDTREPQVGPESIELVGTPPHVLEQEQRAGEVGEEGGAEEAAEDLEVAAHEASFDDAGEQGLIPEKLRGRLGDLAELNPALEDLVRLSTELGEHRSVQAHPPVA